MGVEDGEAARGAGEPETLLFQRLHEEIRLLQHAQALPDYPKQLLQQVQQAILDLYARGQQLAHLLSSFSFLLPSSSSSSAAADDDAAEQQERQQQREDLLLQKQFIELTLVEVLRMRRAYHEEREKILRLMATRACGQLAAFDDETLEKLSDAEQQQLKDLCDSEATRAEQLAWEVAAERNGKFPANESRSSGEYSRVVNAKDDEREAEDCVHAIGEVVFEKDSYLEDPWTCMPRREDEELALLVAAQATGATGAAAVQPGKPPRGTVRLYTCGRLCRFPLYRARQLHAQKLVTLLRVLDCSCSPSPLE